MKRLALRSCMTTVLAVAVESQLLGQPGAPTVSTLIGHGFNPLSQEVLAQCVDFNGTDQELGTPGGTPTGHGSTRYSMRQVTNLSSMSRALDLSAAARFGIGFTKARAEVDFTRSEDVSEFDRFIVVQVSAENQVRSLLRLHLSATGLQYARQGAAAFLEHCGTRFVSGIVTGGRLNGIMHFHTRSAHQASDLQGRMNTSGVGWKAEAQMHNTLNRIAQGVDVSLFVARDGIIEPIPSIDQLVAYAYRFPATIAGSGVFVREVTTPYQAVDNWPPGLVLGDLLNHIHQAEELAEVLAEVTEDRNNVAFVRDNPDQFDLTGYSVTDSVRRAEQRVRMIAQRGQDCVSGVVAACSNTTVTAAVVLPTRRSEPPAPLVHVLDPRNPNCFDASPHDRILRLAGRWRLGTNFTVPVRIFRGTTQFPMNGMAWVGPSGFVNTRGAWNLPVASAAFWTLEEPTETPARGVHPHTYSGDGMQIPAGRTACVQMVPPNQGVITNAQNDPQNRMTAIITVR